MAVLPKIHPSDSIRVKPRSQLLPTDYCQLSDTTTSISVVVSWTRQQCHLTDTAHLRPSGTLSPTKAYCQLSDTTTSMSVVVPWTRQQCHLTDTAHAASLGSTVILPTVLPA